MIADNEDLDALLVDLAAWQKNSDATFIEAGGDPADRKEEGWDTAQEAADAITALRARLQAAEHTIAVKYSGATPCCGQYATCQLPCTPRYRVRAELAESKLQQVKEDAERIRKELDECRQSR